MGVNLGVGLGGLPEMEAMHDTWKAGGYRKISPFFIIQIAPNLLAGQVSVMAPNVLTVLPHIKAGKLRPLAVTSAKRSDVLPDVPTLAEAGVPKYEATIWLGLMAPKATPPAIVERLNAEVSRIVGAPETAKAWTAQGAQPMVMNVAEFTRYVQADIAKWANIVKISGAKPEQ